MTAQLDGPRMLRRGTALCGWTGHAAESTPADEAAGRAVPLARSLGRAAGGRSDGGRTDQRRRLRHRAPVVAGSARRPAALHGVRPGRGEPVSAGQVSRRRGTL